MVKIILAKPAETVSVQENVTSDECAYERNHTRLCDKFQKNAPNNAQIGQLMKETHQERRKRIGDSGEKITVLLSTYPFFKNDKWVNEVFTL